jgi:hypothetical protein
MTKENSESDQPERDGADQPQRDRTDQPKQDRMGSAHTQRVGSRSNPLQRVREKTGYERSLEEDDWLLQFRAERIPLIQFEKIALETDRSDLVRGLVPSEGLVVVWGAPKTGKTFWVLDLVMHVALGWEYRGRRVQDGNVVYCAFEGGRSLRARVEAFRQYYLKGNSGYPAFVLQPTTLDLVKDHPALIYAIDKKFDEYPDIVVLDTLNRSLRGSESRDEDMAAYIRAADSIREKFECAVIIVHHCGLDVSRPRGHTSLSGAADVQIAIRRDKAENIVATVEFNKDGAAGDILCSRLETVTVGHDENGEAITSCVLIPADRTTANRQLPSGQAALALKMLHRAMDDVGEPAPISEQIPTGQATVVRFESWQRYFMDAIAGYPTSEDSKRKAFKRAVTKLRETGLTGICGDFVWPTPDTGRP